MIATICPCLSNSEHTLNTLRYAERVKDLKKPNNMELKQELTNLDFLAKDLMLSRQDSNYSPNYLRYFHFKKIQSKQRF